jgi:hypothetical protein
MLVLFFAGAAPPAPPAAGITQLHTIQQTGLVAAAIKATVKEESARSTSRLRAAASRKSP